MHDDVTCFVKFVVYAGQLLSCVDEEINFSKHVFEESFLCDRIRYFDCYQIACGVAKYLDGKTSLKRHTKRDGVKYGILITGKMRGTLCETMNEMSNILRKFFLQESAGRIPNSRTKKI